jgi:hypothetical protein
MALRAVFEQDSDFKERMFAGQIAVMKGQAWNVVETLKMADHGPLELTRRTRVCVWDDLVDIPVAIPMRSSSAEMRHRHESKLRHQEEEEMDISTVNGISRVQAITPKVSDLPTPSRFDLSRNPISTEMGGSIHHSPESSVLGFNDLTTAARAGAKDALNGAARGGHRKRDSYNRRQGSISHSRHGGHAWPYDGDDGDGDLGFVVAEDMEGSKRKVIVERLETVKSKNPVFTWC